MLFPLSALKFLESELLKASCLRGLPGEAAPVVGLPEEKTVEENPVLLLVGEVYLGAPLSVD